MAKPKVAIIGLGLIGTSLGLALRKAQDDYEIIGHDRDSAKARAASKAGAVHKTEWNLISTVDDADAIILALPASAIRDTMQAIAQDLEKGVVISDTANVKGPVMQWAKELLPPDANFIGGNPILPAGQTGQEPRADMFEGGIYCLIPSVTAAPAAVEFMTSVAELVGAQPFFLDAAEHDGLIAAVEQLSSAVALALLRTTQASSSWKEMRKVAGAAYERAISLGTEDATAHRDAFLTNADNVARWIDALIESLQEVRAWVADGSEVELGEALREAIDARARWLGERERKQWDRSEQAGPELPSRSGRFRQAVLGGGIPGGRRDKEEKEQKKR